jgi:hypothetical protein
MVLWVPRRDLQTEQCPGVPWKAQLRPAVSCIYPESKSQDKCMWMAVGRTSDGFLSMIRSDVKGNLSETRAEQCPWSPRNLWSMDYEDSFGATVVGVFFKIQQMHLCACYFGKMSRCVWCFCNLICPYNFYGGTPWYKMSCFPGKILLLYLTMTGTVICLSIFFEHMRIWNNNFISQSSTSLM